MNPDGTHEARPWQDSLLTKAKIMLRGELIKQPLLQVFFTPEEWKLELTGPLIEAGYLTRPRHQNGFIVFDLTPLAQELLHASDEPLRTVPRY